MHGLGVSDRIRQITQGVFVVRPGSLFPALYRLEQNGWLKSHWGESEKNRKAKYYALTRSGAVRRGQPAARGGVVTVLWTRRLRSFFRILLRRRKADEELDADVRSCFEMLVDRYIERGMSHEEAKRAACWEFEGMEQVKDKVRELRLGSSLATVPQDTRFA